MSPVSPSTRMAGGILELAEVAERAAGIEMAGADVDDVGGVDGQFVGAGAAHAVGHRDGLDAEDLAVLANFVSRACR